ncbi:hypothetical protein QJQ45_009078 [Haematococcus lacustris]|nr:hypothetical protein QJQ45_009078 [Haematococcus lacustris]
MSRTVSFVAMLVVLAVTVQGRTLTQQSGASATAVAQALKPRDTRADAARVSLLRLPPAWSDQHFTLRVDHRGVTTLPYDAPVLLLSRPPPAAVPVRLQARGDGNAAANAFAQAVASGQGTAAAQAVAQASASGNSRAAGTALAQAAAQASASGQSNAFAQALASATATGGSATANSLAQAASQGGAPALATALSQRQILVSQMSRTVSFVAMLVVLAVTVQGRTLTQQSGASATAVAQALKPRDTRADAARVSLLRLPPAWSDQHFTLRVDHRGVTTLPYDAPVLLLSRPPPAAVPVRLQARGDGNAAANAFAQAVASGQGTAAAQAVAQASASGNSRAAGTALAQAAAQASASGQSNAFAQALASATATGGSATANSLAQAASQGGAPALATALSQLHALDCFTAMHYFEFSPFFDRTCDNTQRQILVSQMSRTVSFVAMLVVLAVTVQGRTLTQQSGASATAVAQALKPRDTRADAARVSLLRLPPAWSDQHFTLRVDHRGVTTLPYDAPVLLLSRPPPAAVPVRLQARGDGNAAANAFAQAVASGQGTAAAQAVAQASASGNSRAAGTALAQAAAQASASGQSNAFAQALASATATGGSATANSLAQAASQGGAPALATALSQNIACNTAGLLWDDNRRNVAPSGGLEFVLELEQPPNLFVIRKQMRKGQDVNVPGAVSVMTLYYILDRVVYQTPSLLSALKTRLSRCISAMHSGFAQLQSAGGEQAMPAADTPPSLVDGAGEGQGTAGGLGSRKEAAPTHMVVAKTVGPDEATHWKRTDNIILTVLSRYPLPEMPPHYYTPGAVPEPASVDAAAAEPPLAKRAKQ